MGKWRSVPPVGSAHPIAIAASDAGPVGDAGLEWLQTVLHRAGVARGLTVAAAHAEPVGTGQVGECLRCRLTYEGAGGGTGDGDGDPPASVIVKLPALDPTSRDTGFSSGIYEREVYFYTELARTAAVRVPRCYHGSVSAADGTMVLVLEDLAPAAQGDQLRGCSVGEAMRAMEQAAALHAPYWGRTTELGPEWITGVDVGRRVDAYRAAQPEFAARYRNRLDAEVLDLTGRLADVIDRYLQGSGGPLTLTHGDFRLDNMMFATPLGGAPISVVDWGTIGVREPLSDVAYFLGAGLVPESRREYERSLVDHYCAALAATGLDGVDTAEYWDSYRWYSFSGIFMAVVASGAVRRDERGDELFCVMAERHARQAVELDAFSLLR